MLIIALGVGANDPSFLWRCVEVTFELLKCRVRGLSVIVFLFADKSVLVIIGKNSLWSGSGVNLVNSRCTLVESAFIIIQPELAFDVIPKCSPGNCAKDIIWGNIERKKEWSRLRLDGHLVWIEKSFYLKIRLSSKCRTWDTKLQPRKLQLQCSIPVWISWEVWSPSWSRKLVTCSSNKRWTASRHSKRKSNICTHCLVPGWATTSISEMNLKKCGSTWNKIKRQFTGISDTSNEL